MHEVSMSTWEQRAGQLVWYYGVKLPWGTLPCDGSEYLKTDYPELWAVLETETFEITHTKVFESDSTHFIVPDLVGRVLVGYLLADESQDVTEGWGTETETLSTAQIPAHTHTEKSAVVNPGGYQGGTNRDGTTYSTPQTGSTGGGEAHNNMQPSMRARIAIRYT
jgi:microcystin-dependent protein